MTLFSAIHATKVLALAVALAVGGMTAAGARDRNFDVGWSDGSGGMRSQDDFSGRSTTRREWRERRPRDRYERRAERHRDRHWRKDRDFYGGAISAYRDPGNGTYFYIDRDRDRYYDGPIDTPVVENRRPKVITVTPGRNGCAWEAGVCVIRPGL